MGISLVVGNGHGDRIASATGWGRFGRWVASLDPARFPALANLREEGIDFRIREMTAELVTALEEFPPKEEFAEDIARDVLAFLRKHRRASVVMVQL